MKKNLRIVSAAAAALLAVAPIAAVAGTNPAIVSAAANTQLNFGGSSAPAVTTDVTLNPSITAISGNSKYHISGSISGTISATYNGQSYQANLPTNEGNAKIYRQDTYSSSASTVKPADLRAGYTYRVEIASPSFNFGSANANKTLHIAIPKNVHVTYTTGSGSSATTHEYTNQTLTVTTGPNGVVQFDNMSIRDVKPLDLTNTNAVNFYEKANGNQVQSGSVSINALNGGRLNVSAVVAAITDKYVAAQVNANSSATPTSNATLSDVASEVRSALKAANVTVDNAGWFTAPSSFVVNVAATSNVNGNKATLPVTVNVPNANKPATETGVNKTIMHVASIYDKNGKKTSASEIHAYDTVSVLANPVTINGAKYYKIANKDQYIKVGNIDGTSRTLSHNAYLYHRTASGKFVAKTHRVHKKTRHVVVRKGTQETTYGSALYGKKYYRIGRNQYIKAANFR